MERIATIAVALSVSVMILTLAVIFGFKGEIYSKLTTLSGEMVITSQYGPSTSFVEPIKRSDDALRLISDIGHSEGIYPYRVAPYALRSATLRATNGVDGVLLKGVDSLYNWGAIGASLIDGEMLDLNSESARTRASRNALISKSLASQMELKVGSRVELLLPSDGGTMRRDLYRVGGIFSAGLGEGERQIILTDLRNVQRINGWDSEQISGYEAWLSYDRSGRFSALNDAPYLSYQLNSAIIYDDSPELGNIAAFSIQGIYPSIFDWLITHNVNAVVIITIMLIVAAFNIITALLIMVLERTQMIGLLKSLGMTNRSIRKLFLWRAFGITLRGLVWGNCVGVALCFAQLWFGILKLDESGYMVDVVPIDLSVGWLVLLNLGTIFTILLMVTLPTRFATTIEPSKAIKYQ